MSPQEEMPEAIVVEEEDEEVSPQIWRLTDTRSQIHLVFEEERRR
jgi:hypothetical protein